MLVVWLRYFRHGEDSHYADRWNDCDNAVAKRAVDGQMVTHFKSPSAAEMRGIQLADWGNQHCKTHWFCANLSATCSCRDAFTKRARDSSVMWNTAEGSSIWDARFSKPCDIC